MTDADTSRWDENLREIGAAVARLIAGTAKITGENRWRPFVVGSGAALAIVAMGQILSLTGHLARDGARASNLAPWRTQANPTA